MVIAGGIAGKLGNRYEAKWLIRQLLDVIGEKAQWLRFEGIDPEYRGFEFALGKGEITEWHQTKINASRGNWTISALGREGVLAAFKMRLIGDTKNRCVFVSQDPAKDARILADKANIAENLGQYRGALSQQQASRFDELIISWGDTDQTTFEWLKRCEFLTLPQREIESAINTYSDFYFESENDDCFPTLRDYVEQRMNTKLTTETVRADFKCGTVLRIKDWALDRTLRETLTIETDAYLKTYAPFGFNGHKHPRSQTNQLFELITKSEGPTTVLLTGVAGSGKSGVIRALIEKCRTNDIVNLAFRVDHYLNCKNPRDIGNAILGIQNSPVSILKRVESKCPSILIVDQIDAISEVSGRNGATKEAVLRLIDEARHLKPVRLVFVCRSFDLESDSRLKALKEVNGVEQLDVPLLDWEQDAEPILKSCEVNTAPFTGSQKELLCLPVNLSIFLEIRDEGTTFTSQYDLFDLLLKKKDRAIRSDRSLTWNAIQPLAAIARWMSDRQKLDAPIDVIAGFPRALDLLSSENLIVAVRNRINFFHESLFDYLFARDFSNRDQTLLDLLKSSEQHLFRRTQVRQILETLRQSDFARYLIELESVLLDEQIRFHIKVAVAQWLGTLTKPTKNEKNILLCLHNQDEPMGPIVRYSVLGSSGWFDLLSSEGWINAALQSDSLSLRGDVFGWLSQIAEERPTEIARIVRSWWNGNPDRAIRALEWFSYVNRQHPNDELFSLCQDIIRSNPPNLFRKSKLLRRDVLITSAAKKFPERCSGILKALLDAWFLRHPGKYPFDSDTLRDNDLYALGEIVKKSPTAFLDGVLDAVIRSTKIAEELKNKGSYVDAFRYRACSDHQFGANAFLGLIRSSLAEIAEVEPRKALSYLSRLNPAISEAFLHLHLETISANGRELSQHFLDLLPAENIFLAGWDGADWKSFADAACAVFPYLTEDDRHKVECLIFAHNPEIDRAKKLAREIKTEGESDPWTNRRSLIWVLNKSGFEQWSILETIGKKHLSPFGLRRLRQLRRKFSRSEIGKPRVVIGGWVGPPIERERISHMNDDQWLNAMARYDRDDERVREVFALTGGAIQLAQELQNCTKEAPIRFLSLIVRLPIDANPAYLGHILRGLAESGLEELGPLKNAILIAHSRSSRPYGEQISDLFKKHPKLGRNIELFSVLKWYVVNGEANDEPAVDKSKTEREVLSLENLLSRGNSFYLRGINGARGAAAGALAAVLWEMEKDTNGIWSLIEERVRNESLVSVRCCLIRALIPLFNWDSSKCAELIELLVTRSPSFDPNVSDDELLMPLATRPGTHILPFVIRDEEVTGKRLLERLVNSKDKNMHAVGSFHVFCRSFEDSSYEKWADELIEQSDDQRVLAADVASDAAVQSDFRDRGKAQLLRFFDDDNEQVRKTASQVFGRIDAAEIDAFRDLASSYVRSRAFERDRLSFYRLLKKATNDICELLILGTERLITNISESDKKTSRYYSELSQAQDLIRREYAGSEHDPDLRRRLLDLVDNMLKLDVGGTEKILKAHER